MYIYIYIEREREIDIRVCVDFELTGLERHDVEDQLRDVAERGVQQTADRVVRVLGNLLSWAYIYIYT